MLQTRFGRDWIDIFGGLLVKCQSRTGHRHIGGGAVARVGHFRVVCEFEGWRGYRYGPGVVQRWG